MSGSRKSPEFKHDHQPVRELKRWFLTGTSHMLPFVIAGSILYAVSILYAPCLNDPALTEDLEAIGRMGLSLFAPILGAFIAYAIADKPGLAPGLIGASLACLDGGGVIGGFIAGLIAGGVVYLLKKIKLPPSMKSLGAIFLYPLFGTLITGLLVLHFVTYPSGVAMRTVTDWCAGLSQTGRIPLGLILGALTAFDMGGPINKIATLFAQMQVADLPYLMGGVGVSIATPPLGMALAVWLSPKKYTLEEHKQARTALLLGCVGISEGAIPYATNDPKSVLPALIIGGAAGNALAFYLGVINYAPWGGLIVLPVVENWIGYLASILAGSLLTALIANLLKKEKAPEASESELLDLNFEDF